MNVVISQSMLFPWVGLLEQVRLADVFVHYDDVQFSKGSFVNRVQIKTSEGMRWMTVPLEGLQLGQRINEVRVAADNGWKARHLGMLERSFKGAPHAQDALELVREVYAEDHPHLGALARASLLALCKYLALDNSTRFIDVESMNLPGHSSDRVLQVVKAVGGDNYVTGHGAANYLDHVGFASQGVTVRYMDYQKRAYPQFHGPLTPHVSGLDLVAHCGRAGKEVLTSGTVDWPAFLQARARLS